MQILEDSDMYKIPFQWRVKGYITMIEIEERYELMYDFENNSKLYDFRFKDTGIPMWMYIRANYINRIVDREVYKQYQHIWNKDRRDEIVLKKSLLEKYITKNPFLTCKKDILFAFWSYSELRQHDGGFVYEDFIMPFLKVFPKNTSTLMTGSIVNKYEKNCLHPNWKMDDIFMDMLRVTGCLKRKKDICDEDRKNIHGLINFLNRNCPLQIYEDIIKEIGYSLEHISCYSKQMIKICQSYLSILNPKVVIICCASYPSLLRTSMILACRNRKIKTAELQHGLNSKYHVNYQFCDYILNNTECRKMLPDYYLTFGKYWNNIIKVPYKCYVIGYAKTLLKELIPNNNKILFCADIDFDRYIDFLDKIIQKLDIEIYFRFHPRYSSKQQRDKFKKYFNYSNFFEADEKDLSFYMKDCRYVIADGSTVCYEALSMGRIVFSFESKSSIKMGVNKLSDVHLITNANDFMVLWNERDKLQSRCHDEFFNLNYKENYIKFLKKCGVDITSYKVSRRRVAKNERK